MLEKVEMNCFVVEFDVGNFGNNILELHVVPCCGGMIHYGSSSIVKFIILYIEISELCPVVLLITDSDQLGDVQAGGEELDVLHELIMAVSRIKNSQFSEDPHVGPFQSQAALH